MIDRLECTRLALVRWSVRSIAASVKPKRKSELSAGIFGPVVIFVVRVDDLALIRVAARSAGSLGRSLARLPIKLGTIQCAA